MFDFYLRNLRGGLHVLSATFNIESMGFATTNAHYASKFLFTLPS